MTLYSAAVATVIVTLTSWGALKSSRTVRIGLIAITVAWLVQVVLIGFKLQLGCHPIGDCYGTEYDGDLGIAGSLSGLILIFGFLLALSGALAHLWNLIRARKVNAES